MVECLLDTQDVIGSNPLRRTNLGTIQQIILWFDSTFANQTLASTYHWDTSVPVFFSTKYSRGTKWVIYLELKLHGRQ